MTALLWFTIAITRAWTATYTRGLPRDLRGERREEVDCDLWEHQRLADLERESVAGTAVEILMRMAFGIPSDIFWRLDAGADARSERGTVMNESTTTKRLYWAFLLVLALVPLYSLQIVINHGWEGVAFAIVPLIGGGVIASGLMATPTSPGRGLALVAIGWLLIAVGWFWMFPITIPLGIALIAFTYKRGRRFSGTFSPRPA
jgi:hypothetical protein